MDAIEIKLPWALPKGAVIKTIGVAAIVLEYEYDDRQLWLPFMNVILAYIIPDQIMKKHLDIEILEKRKYFLIHDMDRAFYTEEEGVHQLILPFNGWKDILNSNWKKIIAAKFPAWDLRDNGAPYYFIFSTIHEHRLRQFAQENCKGRFRITKKLRKAYFQYEEDYGMCKLAYGIGE